jgi:NADP-dependent alcohol dehydrogenase
MLNFEFKNPTKIIFGKDSINKLSNEIPSDSKILIVYGGGSIHSNGVYQKIKTALSNFNVFEFGGIQANPEYEILLNALDIIKKENIDFLLAVGGGSVIDGVKFLSSATYYNEDDKWQILEKGYRTEKGLPFGVVLTLPATGSEMNSGAVISRKETKQKLGMGGPGLFPLFSILDPEVIQSLPKKQLENGIADAFTHVLEQYMTYPVGAILQDRFAESILQTLLEIAPILLDNPYHYETASNFMWSCTMALNGLIQKGVPSDWAIHTIGHELTALYSIDHARTLAIIAANRYRYSFTEKREKLAQCAERVFKIQSGTEEEKALHCINKIKDFFHSINIPTKLSSYNIEYQKTGEIIEDRFTKRGWNGIGENKNISPSDVRKIIEMSV